MINGGGASISTGTTEAAQSKGYVSITDAMNVASWRIYANASGVIVVDVWTQILRDLRLRNRTLLLVLPDGLRVSLLRVTSFSSVSTRLLRQQWKRLLSHSP
jgi:hypothetical protein